MQSNFLSDTITKTLSCPKNVCNKKIFFSMHRSVDMVSRRPFLSLTQSGYSFCITCIFISNTTIKSRPLLALVRHCSAKTALLSRTLRHVECLLLASVRHCSAKTALLSRTLRHVECLLLASFRQHGARFVLCVGMIGELRWTCRHGTLCDHLFQVVEDV